jgi:hypothetical protein
MDAWAKAAARHSLMALPIDKCGAPAQEAYSHLKGTGGVTHELSTCHFFRCIGLPEATGYIPPPPPPSTKANRCAEATEENSSTGRGSSVGDNSDLAG